jgi:threonine/homoserine/homoserine lactone efflux protein
VVDLSLFVFFLFVSSILIVLPGPNVLLVLATSLAHGRVRAFQTIIGTLVAMAFQLYVAAVSTAWLAVTLSETFEVLKWLGVVYLVYIGVARLRAACNRESAENVRQMSGSGTFWRGFLVGLTNPKTILFFGAFLPQWTTASLPIGPQIAVLSVTFLVLAAIFDSVYAVSGAALRDFVSRPTVKRLMDGLIGTLFVGSGVTLAIARQS